VWIDNVATGVWTQYPVVVTSSGGLAFEGPNVTIGATASPMTGQIDYEKIQ